MQNVALIIDDEEDTCLLLKKFLIKKGILSYYTHTLREGMDKAFEVKPHWLFLDNNLPDGFGIDKVGEIRILSPDSKIIMISAMGNFSEIAISTGADSFIEKPLDLMKIEKFLLS